MTGMPQALAPETRAQKSRANEALTREVAVPAEAPPRWLWLAAGGLVAGAFAVGLLWATQGGAVFFELVTAGFSACF
jgi:hypothetical protein